MKRYTGDYRRAQHKMAWRSAGRGALPRFLKRIRYTTTTTSHNGMKYSVTTLTSNSQNGIYRAPSVPERVGLVAALVVHKEGFLSALGGLTASPGHVPLFALDFAIEDIVFLVSDPARLERVICNNLERLGRLAHHGFPVGTHHIWALVDARSLQADA